MKLHVTNINYAWGQISGRQVVTIYGRDEDGTAHEVQVPDYYPSLYVPTTDAEERTDELLMSEGFRTMEDGYESIYGDELTRIEVEHLRANNEIADMFDVTFEADTTPEVMIRVDCGIKTGIEIPEGVSTISVDEITPVETHVASRVLTFDIETDDRGAFPKPGAKPILSLVSHDSQTGEYVGFFDMAGRDVADVFPEGKPEGFDRVECYPDEEDMLSGFAEYIRDVDPDLICGWNSADFDVPYYIRRMEKLDLPVSNIGRNGYAGINKSGYVVLGGRTSYDLLPAYKRTQRGELDSYSLSSVAQAELGSDKVDHTGQSIYEMWSEDPYKLMKYNLHDVRLTVEINEKSDVLGFYDALRAEVGSDWDMTNANNQFVEIMVRRKLHEWGKIAPTRPTEAKQGKYTGAHVVDPFWGRVENVLGMDLASLYPYTMAMLNASPEVRVDTDRVTDEIGPNGERYAEIDGETVPVALAPNDVAFRQDQLGLFPALVEDAIDLKKSYKKEKKQYEPGTDEYEFYETRYAVSKTITNSIYGTIGWAFFIMYDDPTAEAVTLTGQEVIKATQLYLDSQPDAVVVYGDTDSNYVAFDAEYTKDECISAAFRHAEVLNDEVYPEVAREWGITSENLWDIEVESYARTFFQAGKKKRYAMHVTWKEGKDVDETKIVGFDTNRSDTAQITKDLMGDVLNLLVHGDDDEIASRITEAGVRLRDPATSPDYYAIPKGISKNLGSYETKTESIRGAENANKLLRKNYGAGSKPKRLRIRPQHFPETGVINVISFDEAAELPEGIVPDYDEMEEKTIVTPVQRIVDPIGLSVTDALAGIPQTEQQGLDAFC